MAGNISEVDLSGMQQLAQSSQTAIEGMRSALNTYVSTADSLAAGWTGQAANSFQQAVANLQEKGTNLNNTLQQMAQLVGSTTNVQSTTNDNTASSAQQAASIGSSAPSGLIGL